MQTESVRVYLVDDDSIFAVITEVTLKKLYSNVELKHFTDARVALDAILNDVLKPPSILFLDINMPLFDGWEFLAELEDRSATAFPICMVSSSIDPQDKKRAAEHPMVIDFVEKPFEKDRLRSLIDSL